MAKGTSKFRVFANTSDNVYTDTEYDNNDERKSGSAPNTPISSKLINTALREPSLVTASFMELLTNYNETAVGSENDANYVEAYINTALKEYINKNTPFKITTTRDDVNGDKFKLDVGVKTESVTITNANHSKDSENVKKTINGKKITDIFETNGTTIKQATNATHATEATNVDSISNQDIADNANVKFKIGDQSFSKTVNKVEHATRATNVDNIEKITSGVMDDVVKFKIGDKTYEKTINNVTHAASASSATTASTATKANTIDSAGSSSLPVYIDSDGKAKAVSKVSFTGSGSAKGILTDGFLKVTAHGGDGIIYANRQFELDGWRDKSAGEPDTDAVIYLGPEPSYLAEYTEASLRFAEGIDDITGYPAIVAKYGSSSMQLYTHQYGDPIVSVTITGETGVGKANEWTTSSDERLKEDIKPHTFKKSILDLPVKSFRFKATGKDCIGCVAQDLQKICPELVLEDKDTKLLSIRESKIVYPLIQETKKLRDKVDSLEKRIAALEKIIAKEAK